MSNFPNPETEGWDLFEVNATGYLEIEACGEVGIFETDSDAFRYIIHNPHVAAELILRMLNTLNARPGVIAPEGREGPQTPESYGLTRHSNGKISAGLSPAKMRWWIHLYREVRGLRDDPANTPEAKERFTNILAGLILIKDE